MYYSIGVGHKEFTADKFNDEDYYVLTLAAIARELRRERITEANVFIAAGLPLTWVSEQKADFKKYLLQHNKVTFTFRGTEYRIKIVGVEIYPQGFAAVAEKLGDFKSVNMLCDIGNGTMNLLRIVNKKPDAQRMFTEKYGTHQCALLITPYSQEKRVIPLSVMPIPQKICLSKKIGNTVYDVTANFNMDGKETILQQFKTMILAAEL